MEPLTLASPRSFVPSPEQAAFFNALTTTSDNLLLRACAGSGKTTTIVEAVRLLPGSARAVFLAFNRDIADELKRRLPPHCSSATFHSLGFAAWKRHAFPKTVREPDPDKCFNILRKKLPDKKEQELYFTPALQLVSLAKSCGLDTRLMPDTPESWASLLEHFDLICDGRESRLIEIASKLLAESNTQRLVLDFDDMLYFPLRENVAFPSWDYIFVDEGQDTNAVQAALLAQMMQPAERSDITGCRRPDFPRPAPRLVVVGDPHQAIYGFRGADASALDNLATQFRLRALPLSVSRRCSHAVAAEAARWVEGDGHGFETHDPQEPLGPTMLGLHGCDEGRTGISDLIGAITVK